MSSPAVPVFEPDPVDALIARASREGWPATYSKSLVFRRPELNTLLKIWREKAGHRLAPRRNDMDARALKPVLRRITIVERVNEHNRCRLRSRLVGSDIAHRFGDHTGRFLDEFIPAHLLPRWSDVYDAVIDACCPIRVWAPFDHPRVSYLTGECLLAPLLDESGDSNLLLTATYFFRRGKDCDNAEPAEGE